MYNTKKLILIILSYSFLFSSSITFRGKTKEQVLKNQIPLSFANLVSNNYEILPSQINAQRGSYMIIAPDNVVEYLNDFSTFKKSQGFDVYMLSLTEAGSTPIEIKNTIANTLLEDPMLEYVLLIGDVDGFSEFPSFYYGPENDVTDQQYTHILGDDSTPDVFIGRLSIDSLSDLAVIMSKTIQYVRNPLAFDDDWLDRGLVVAGNYANTYPIPITPKWTSYWLMEELLDYGYDEIDTVFYPPIQQGAPYIIPIIDEGVGIVNYRGWGDANGWHYPEFHVDDVNDLNNGWLTPVFFSYVCNSNDFANNVDPCLAEAVIRGGTPTVPKGGVAFIGPSDLHTSTKYNNVINAYMYDAMLNHGIYELGPAMQAGQYGLTKEFPAQNGPGEAQEFYANVYNILGDPSLQVYIDTPGEFNFYAEPLNDNEGLIDFTLTDEDEIVVKNAVISVMNGTEILSKGLTDDSGRYLATINIDDVSHVDIYANKGGFIQGHMVAQVENSNNSLILKNITVYGEHGNDVLSLAEQAEISFTLENTSNTDIPSFSGEFIFSNHAFPTNLSIDIPNIPANSSININDISIAFYGLDSGQGVLGKLLNQDGDIIFSFNINIDVPVFGISFENEVAPNDVFEPSLRITNYSGGNYSDISVGISTVSDGADIEFNSTSNQLSNFLPFETSTHNTNYSLILGDVSYGSNITFRIGFSKNGEEFFSSQVELGLKPNGDNYPVAPNNFGYWAYDDNDEGYDAKPTFNWIELDPNYGGISDAIHYQLDDDDHVDLELPFTFKYHGINYNNITVSSNGWASFVPCDIDYFWNMSIPMYMGPKALLAPFSDDLETIDSDGDGIIDIWINIYTWYDEENGRFIIEWSRALNGYDEETEETFQVILHDQNSIPTSDANGVIDFQYLEIYDIDVTKNYSTVGIEAPQKNYGTQYVFNNVYAPGASPLQNERAIRFTTQAPDNYISSLDIDRKIIVDQFSLSPAYPNPFNPQTHFDLKIVENEIIDLFIIDLLGRRIASIYNGFLFRGKYKFTWDGKDQNGIPLSSGAYFTVAMGEKNSAVQKILLLK